MSPTIDFGKHNGETLVQIAFSDPAWFVWALSYGIFRQRGQQLHDEAAQIWEKARAIRIPEGYPEGSQAAYYYHGRTGKFMDLMIVADPRYEEHAYIRNVLDLGHVCESGRDGLGNKLLVKAIKRILFGKSARVTRDTLEQFFNDPDNFDLSNPMRQAAE